MEFKNLVYNAARDGKLYRLKVFLDHRSKDEIATLISAYTNGATPLMMACKNGHLEVALYLLLKCNADIEQAGSVAFDGETIEGAHPLWCAAAAGHLSLVKTLIRYKASINKTTKTNSTPLRAACFDGHFEVVKCLVQHGADIEIANRHGHTCLMIACYKGHFKIAKYLIDCGADVNRKSTKGNTALHDCAESGSLEILKLLLEHGAVLECDSSGTTPLMSAAITGHASVVEYFIQELNCGKEANVNALELLGATFMDKKKDMIKALEYWRRALKLRYEDTSFPLEKPTTDSPIALYVDATEFRTFLQLEELISDPDEMRIQALLIRERILGPAHPDAVYYIRYRGATYADGGNFDRCIQLWMYALDVQQSIQEPLSSMTQSSLLAFVELFSFMLSKAWSFSGSYPFNDILHVFQRALTELESALKMESQQQDLSYSNQFHRFVLITMHLIGLMCRLEPQLNKNEQLKLKKSVHQFIRMNLKTRNGWTPLHLACLKDSTSLGRYPVFTFPSPEVVNLFLDVGACPNVVDSNRNTPLHIVAMNKPCATNIFTSLLNHGAHLDLCNYNKQTPLMLIRNTTLLDIYPLQYMNLQCLSASAIKTYKIPYHGLVHKQLEVFIDAH